MSIITASFAAYTASVERNNDDGFDVEICRLAPGGCVAEQVGRGTWSPAHGIEDCDAVLRTSPARGTEDPGDVQGECEDVYDGLDAALAKAWAAARR